MASGSDWKVQLEAIIDTSNISQQLKNLATEKLKIDADLDLTAFTQGKKTMVDSIQEVGNQIKSILGESISESLGDKQINQFATEYVQSWQRATQQVQSDIEKTLNSLNNFSMKNADFSSFSTEIDGAKVSVEELKSQLETMKLTGDITGLDNIKSQFETLKTSFTEVERNTQQVDKALESLETFSFKNAGFENFSSEINGAQVSVEGLKNELNNMKISGDFSGLSTVKTEISMLEQEFNNLSQQASRSLESLNNFSLSHAGFDSFRTEIDGVEMSVEELKQSLSNMQVTGDFSGLDNIRNQISTIKTEFEEVSKIQFNMDVGSYEAQVESIVAKTQQWVDANGNATISTDQLASAYQELAAASEAYKNDGSVENTQRLIQAEEQLQQALLSTKNAISETNAEFAKTSQVESLLQRVTEFTDKNSAAMGKWGAELKSMMAELSSGTEMPISRLRELETEFKQIGNAAREAGDLGQSFGDKIGSAMSKFSYWTSATMIVMNSVRVIRDAISTVYDLDTALVDLQKTTTMTNDELEDFYYDANTTAIQMGVTTEEIIDQAAAWSRLGYSSQDAATTMAALSSQFASISPGMDTETAQEGLVSTMKAFGIDVDDVLDGIMSKINIVGNTAATTNADIVEMLERSSSAMSEANNSLEETIALETAAVEITQNSANVGTAYKTLAARIRGYDEETESYTLDVEELNGEIANLTKTADTPGGISLFTDDAKTEYKSTYQLLKEISEVYDQLDDKTQANKTCLCAQKCA